jgi:hypothetical protein
MPADLGLQPAAAGVIMTPPRSEPESQDRQGKTAADRAERNAMYDVAAFLKEAKGEGSGWGGSSGPPSRLRRFGKTSRRSSRWSHRERRRVACHP